MKLSKVYVSKSSSAIDYATEEYIADYLTALKARSNLPIDQILTMVCDNRVDSASCSRDDTNYSFFVSQSRQGIAITVKKLGEDTIEFNVPCKILEGKPKDGGKDEPQSIRESLIYIQGAMDRRTKQLLEGKGNEPVRGLSASGNDATMHGGAKAAKKEGGP